MLGYLGSASDVNTYSPPNGVFHPENLMAERIQKY